MAKSRSSKSEKNIISGKNKINASGSQTSTAAKGNKTSCESVDPRHGPGSGDGELVVCDNLECSDIERDDINENIHCVSEESVHCVTEENIHCVTEESANEPMIDNLKSTINEVFWDKINSHVEKMLNTYEIETKQNNSTESTELAFECKPLKSLAADQAEGPCPKLINKKDAVSLKAAQKQSHRRSMLEISSPEIDDNLISVFRRGMHCTDACIIRVVDICGVVRQSHINRTIPMVCIDRAMLQDNLQRLQPDTFLRIVRMQNVASIYVFQMSDVFAKRSVIKGGDILRTLAVSEMREKFDFEEQSMDKETRKVMYNKFTNMQRLDRGIGSRLKWQFMERHNIEETDTIASLEEKASVSFSIFGPDGSLTYESKKYMQKHVSMIKDKAGLYYFIPQKMLGAFGSQWNRRYRSHRYFNSRTSKSNNPDTPPPTAQKSTSSKKTLPKTKKTENKDNVRKNAWVEYREGKNSCVEFRKSEEEMSLSDCKPRVVLMSDSQIAKHKDRANLINETMQFTNINKKCGPSSDCPQENIKLEKSHLIKSKGNTKIMSDSQTLDTQESDLLAPKSGTERYIGPLLLENLANRENDAAKNATKLPEALGKGSGRFICKSQETGKTFSVDFNRMSEPTTDSKAWPAMRNQSVRPVGRQVDEYRIDRKKKILVRAVTTTDTPDSGCQSSARSSATLVKQESVIDMSGTIAAVSRVPSDNVPTVRLIPMGGLTTPSKRPPNSEVSPRKRNSISVLSKNQILTKGEVLLTTKDHIIFRIPRTAGSHGFVDSKLDA